MNWNLYSTKTIADTSGGYPNKHYCVYCGKEALLSEDWDRHEHYTYRYCDCENAKKERELTVMMRQMPKQDDKFVNSIKHQNEIHKVNCRYGIHND